MQEILNKIDTIIIDYEMGVWVSSENLRVLLRELSANYYYLTKLNIEFAQQHNMVIYNFKGSDAGGQRFAELKVPELRKSRKILYATAIVLNSIRSEIGLIRAEL